MATSAERYCNEEQKWWSQPVSRPPCTPNQQAIANYNKFIANYSKLYPGGPIPHNLARALMPRQPYSVAVLSTGGRLHPRFLRFLSPTRGTEGVVKTIERDLGRKWSSPCRRDGEVEKIPFYRLFDSLLKQERWLLAEFLLELARIDGITHIKNRKKMTIQYFPSIYVLSKSNEL